MSERDDILALMSHIETWVQELGFNGFGISTIKLDEAAREHQAWLDQGYHGGMAWLQENSTLRYHPDKLVEGTATIVSVRLNYLNEDLPLVPRLKEGNKAYVAAYAQGRDYHKLMRKRLAQLGKRISDYVLEHALHPAPNTRAFVDSAPVLERPIAEQAGLGWTGKHTLILNEHEGSWFFLGELFTNLPLPPTPYQAENHCGDCEACLQICPTDAFPAPYTLDASRCISYLTIEHKGAIPVEFREPMGNRIFGCDDCQIICPWNKFAKHTEESDFRPRAHLDNAELLDLFAWSEEAFLKHTEGSAIRRTGYENWQRNVAVALGNAPQDLRIIEALEARRPHSSAMVQEHIDWALMRQRSGTRRKRKIRRPSA